MEIFRNRFVEEKLLRKELSTQMKTSVLFIILGFYFLLIVTLNNSILKLLFKTKIIKLPPERHGCKISFSEVMTWVFLINSYSLINK